MKYKFNASDAWLMLALIYAHKEGHSDIASIIAAADYINHAILTYEELQNGLSKLSSSGFIKETKKNFSPTKKIIDFYQMISKPKKSVLNELDDISAYLNAEPWSAGKEHILNHEYPSLSRKDFKNEVQKYIASTKQKLNKKKSS